MSFAKRDIIRFYFPIWKYAVDSLRQGDIPFWNPYLSFGTPLFANIQACVFYPLSLILYLPDYTWAFNFYILVHLALASVFTCLWMNDNGASRWASFASGLSYGLGGYVLSAINLTISLTTLVYFPLTLFTLRRALKSHSYTWKAAGAAVLLVQYLAGDPAIFFATLVVYVFFVFFRTLENTFHFRRFDWRPAWCLTQIIGTFLGLAAFHYLLFFEFLSHSNRVNLSYDFVTMWSMQYNDLLSIFIPYFSDVSMFFMDYWVRQSWLDNYYLGVSVLVFVLVAVIKPKKNIINYHILLLLLGLALALGRHTLIHRFLYDFFPFFKFIRYPVRFFFLFSFAASCLAGFGIDRVLAYTSGPNRINPSSKKAFRDALLILASAGIFMIAAFVVTRMEPKIYVWVKRLFDQWTGGYCAPESVLDMTKPVIENIKRTVIIMLLLAAGIFCARYLKVRQSILAIFFTFLIFADLADVNMIEMRIEKECMTKTGRNAEKILQDNDLFRVIASPQTAKMQLLSKVEATLGDTQRVLMDALTPNFLLTYRIADTVGYDSVHLKGPIRINSMRDRVLHVDRNRFFDMLNVKYLASPLSEIGGRFELVSKTEHVNIFLNKTVLPRAFLINRAEFIDNPDNIAQLITSENYIPEEIVYLEEDPPRNAGLSRSNFDEISEKLDIVEYKPEYIRMKVTVSKNPWLFLSDTFFPGWKAFVDGKNTKIYKANSAFRAVYLEPGTHDVIWRYEPTHLRLGAAISLTTFALILYYFFKKKKKSGKVICDA